MKANNYDPFRKRDNPMSDAGNYDRLNQRDRPYTTIGEPKMAKTSGTTEPNGTIAGADHAGGTTGDRSMSTGMPMKKGGFKPHYGPTGAGGKGTAPLEGPLPDQEKAQGTKGKKMKPKKFTSIQQLRDHAKASGAY